MPQNRQASRILRRFQSIFRRPSAHIRDFAAKLKFHASLGRKGERAARRYLRRLGYFILEHNWRCEGGEVDIIAARERKVFFFEVKTRSAETVLNFGAGEAVDKEKVRRIMKAADDFLYKEKLRLKRARLKHCKFEIIEVTYRRGWVWGFLTMPNVRIL